MCQFKSGVAVKAGESVKVYTLEGDDSHENIRIHYKIRDDDRPGAQYQTPVELIAVRGLGRFKDYDFVFDAERPNWWTDEMTEEAKQQLFATVQHDYQNNRIAYEGNLDLSSLTSLPKGVTLEAGGGLYLSSLTSLPKGVIVKYRKLFLKE